MESWTAGYLHRQLIDNLGVDPDVAGRLMIWFDPAEAIMDPDESKTADELFDRGSISWEAHRRRKGSNDEEAPTPEELDERARLGLLKGSGTATTGPVPNGGQAPEDPAARSNGHRPRTAAVRRSLGQRSMEVDRALRTRLAEAIEGALHRGLSAAGARVRSRAHREPNVVAAIATTPNHRVVAQLPTGTVAALGLDEEVLMQAALDDLGPRWEAQVGNAQAATRRLLVAEFDLDADEEEQVERRQDRDRADGWLWLAAAVLTLGRSRLHDPTPPIPSRGEVDPSSSVLPSMVREAVARAGGATDTNGRGLGLAGPAGGVATGATALSVWAAHGAVVGGWEWSYGDPGARQLPFPGHEDLDGVRFAHWSDAVLIVSPEDAWLGTTHYRPGDHDGCRCDFIPLTTDEVVPTDAERFAELAR